MHRRCSLAHFARSVPVSAGAAHLTMRDNLVYMFGKLAQAVRILIVDPSTVRERVWAAAAYLSMVQAGGLPESCRADIKWIHGMLTRFPATRHYTSQQATFRRTRNITASRIAARIWTLYHLMEAEIDARQR